MHHNEVAPCGHMHGGINNDRSNDACTAMQAGLHAHVYTPSMTVFTILYLISVCSCQCM